MRRSVSLNHALAACCGVGVFTVLVMLALNATMEGRVTSNERRITKLEGRIEAMPDGTGVDRWTGQDMKNLAEDFGRENEGLVIPSVDRYRDDR